MQRALSHNRYLSANFLLRWEFKVKLHAAVVYDIDIVGLK